MNFCIGNLAHESPHEDDSERTRRTAVGWVQRGDAEDPGNEGDDGSRDLVVRCGLAISAAPAFGCDAPRDVRMPAIAARLAPGDEVVIGSAPAAAVHLAHPTVSRRHALLRHAGGAVEVHDLGSTNGIIVNGLRVIHAIVPVGSELELGEARVVFERVGCATPSRQGPTRTGAPTCGPLGGLIGESLVMRRLALDVRRIASLKLAVLVRGESGTGKELVARAIHVESPRARAPFVAINCATITRELAESELFGHARGAFTGAHRERRGAFREAHGGTLFLDEIGSLPLELQAKLLRVVEDGVVRAVGSEQLVPVDVRLVTATCEPLEKMVTARQFRADLYERLAACVVRVPPLRERRGDIPEIARHLLATSGIEGKTLSSCAIARLRSHGFPGNVRELRNVIVQAALRADDLVEAEHVDAALAERSGTRRRVLPEEAMRFFEAAGRNVSEAARRADLPRTTMRDLLRAAGVPPGGGLPRQRS